MDIVPRLSRRVITYGIHEEADFRALGIETQVEGWQFQVSRPRHEKNLSITLAVPGMHNVLNALAAIAVATDEGLADISIVEGLQGFQGVERRFQIDNNIVVGGHQLTLVDDYGHHPTEVAAVIDTARRVWPEKRLAMVYQPHRFSRTQDLFEDFVRVLSTVDALLLLDVYAAGEKPIPGADGPALSQAIRQRGSVSPVFAQDANEALGLLAAFCQEDDVLVVQGAGNVSTVSRNLRGEDV
jgi:UDP-N-acetylmuramate--alanine ligase